MDCLQPRPAIFIININSKKIILKYKFNETKSVVGVEDLELWLRLFFDLKRKILFFEDPLVYIERKRLITSI